MKFGKIKFWSRFSLTTKILIVFLTLSIASLAVIGFFFLINIKGVGKYALESSTSLGDRAVSDSTNALEDQAEEYLLRLAKDQAAISNTLFEKVEAATNVVARYASTLWSNPSSSQYRRSYSQKEKPEDIYSTSVYVLASGITADTVREELNLSNAMDDIFMSIYANNRNLTRIYIGTESGILRAYPWFSEFPSSYDPRKRGWYQRAANTGEIGWTELYVDASGHGLMVTCSQSFYGPQGKLIGVIGTDVTLKSMNERIINTQVGKLGYAFLIDDNGKIVARPGLSSDDKKWDEIFEVENLLQSDNPELKKIAENMITGNSGVARCRFEDSEKYITYAPLTCTSWSIGIVVPIEEIIASTLATKSQISLATEDTKKKIESKTNSMQNTFIGIFVAIILVVAGLTFSLSRRIASPILKVTHAAQAMEKGELGEEEIASLSQNKGEDEVASLSRVFASMATQVKARENRLRRRVEELRIKIDQSNKAKEVARITESDYFQSLQETAEKMREKSKEK